MISESLILIPFCLLGCLRDYLKRKLFYPAKLIFSFKLVGAFFSLVEFITSHFFQYKVLQFWKEVQCISLALKICFTVLHLSRFKTAPNLFLFFFIFFSSIRWCLAIFVVLSWWWTAPSGVDRWLFFFFLNLNRITYKLNVSKARKGVDIMSWYINRVKQSQLLVSCCISINVSEMCITRKQWS
mgnify:CR=1 FL=1